MSAIPWRVGNAHPKPLCSVMKSGINSYNSGYNSSRTRRNFTTPLVDAIDCGRSYYTFRTDQNGAVAPSCGQQVLANIAIGLGELFSGTTILSNQNRSNRPAYIYLVVRELSTKGRHDL